MFVEFAKLERSSCTLQITGEEPKLYGESEEGGD